MIARLQPAAFAVLAILGLAACAAPGARSADGPAAFGREVAQMRCADCHGIDAATASPLEGAPRLSEIAAGRYDLQVLAEEFAQGVHVGGGAMPKFTLTLDEIDALTAYLQSISAPPPPPPGRS